MTYFQAEANEWKEKYLESITQIDTIQAQIQRVRDLARKFEAEDGDGNSFMQYGLAAARIYSALDGEIGSVEDVKSEAQNGEQE